MKNQLAIPVRRRSVVAVRGVLLAMALAQGVHPATAADGDGTAALTRPSSSIELGAQYLDHDSAKFGEFNGLDKKGVTAIGNIDLQGGSAYDSAGTTRYRLRGTDLGTDSRSLDARYGEQGRYRLDLGVDELQRNRSDSYQTPLLGVGGGVLTLPPNWRIPDVPCVSTTAANARGLSAAVTQASCLVAGQLRTPTSAQRAIANAIQGTDLPMFREVDLYTRRLAESASFAIAAGPNLDLSASIRHEKKEGYKPMGAATRMAGGDMATIIPDPIQQNHDQYTLGAAFHQSGNALALDYYGSHFGNDINSVSWQNWGGGASGAGNTAIGSAGVNTMSSAPSNDFHQLSLTGSHDFSGSTHLVAKVAVGRNTQNAAFVTDPTDLVVPVNSANAEVVTRSFNLRLTSQVSRDLGLSGAYKYDLRDNRTAVHTFQYADNQEAANRSTLFTGTGASAGAPAVLAQNANANLPYSRRVQAFSLDANYRLTAAQTVRAGYETQTTERWCSGSWIDCVEADKTRDNTLKLEWHSNLLDDLSGHVDYAYAMRRVGAYNENAFLAIVPYAGVVPNGATMSAVQYMRANGLNGYGPVAGYAVTTGNANIFFPNNNALSNVAYANENRISELPGLREFNEADRNRDRLRAGLDWQASDEWNWSGSFDYTNDDHFNSTYGLKQASDWAFNLEASYAPSRTFSAAVYASWEEQRQQIAGNSYTANSAARNVGGFTAISGGCYATIALRNASNKIDPCLNWSNDMRDRLDTLGASFRKSGLLHDRLDLAGDLSFSRARTQSSPYGGNYVNNPLAVSGAAAGTVAAFFVPASDLPSVTTDTLDLRLTAGYRIDKASSVRLGYGFHRMRSEDYAYQGLQAGGLSGVLPDFEQAPNYTVHSIAASYRYTFE